MRIQLPGHFPLRQANLQADGFEDTSTLVLDARSLWWASPLELAAIVAMGTSAAHQGRKVELLLPHADDVRSYLARMNVIDRLAPFARIDDAPAGQHRNDRSSTLLEVTDITSSNADHVAALLGRMATAEFGTRIGAAAFKCLGELIGNATTHGAGGTPAFTAAQLYTGAKSGQPGFEVAVCDAGVGILEHLRASVHHQDLTDSQDALERAMGNGITGAPEGRGCGLGNLRDHASRDGGSRLMLRSGSAIANVLLRGERRILFRSVATPIDGTWATLRVRVS